MRCVVAVAMMLPFGCAHQARDRNLAQRQSVTAPRGELERASHRREPPANAIQRADQPLVTPPVP